jgi:hypothetical protein
VGGGFDSDKGIHATALSPKMYEPTKSLPGVSCVFPYSPAVDAQARLGVRAMLAGTMANLMSASIAGMLI